MDLRVIRIERGTGRNKDRLGKAIVEYKGNEVGGGSGFSDEQRNHFGNIHTKLLDILLK